ncbi:MAG TPA: energy transducer TonB [Candidatus Limnocylindrales bacterium]|nr:energy transducer TonB [Candidatus Limnocylindrales bacterium]
MTDDLRRLGLSFVTCLSLSLLAVPAHGSAQQTPAQNSAQQEVAPQTVAPISELDMDAFAAKVVPEITKRHFSKVAVFGALGPADELTVLGPMIGDALSATLMRQAQGFQVIDRSVVRERLQQERLSDSTLLTGKLAAWISQLMGAQGLVLVDFGYFHPPKITITASLFDIRRREESAFSTVMISFVPDALQNDQASRPLYSDRTVRDEYNRLSIDSKQVSENPQITPATCISCPVPEYSGQARRGRIQGEIWLLVTVTPEGKATEITVVRAAGYGLDEQAVIAVRDWKFKPAVDKDGKAVKNRLPVEVRFQME